MSGIVPVERVEPLILLVRGERVLLDSDLAALYGVPVKRLNEQVRRNLKRFPGDFMFHLNPEEAEALRSQVATLKTGRGRHRKYLPYVFTEQGVAMLSGVLHSDQAIRVNIAIMRAFVRFRAILAAHKEVAGKLAELERKISTHDTAIRSILEAIQELMTPPGAPPKPRIGFHHPGKGQPGGKRRGE